MNTTAATEALANLTGAKITIAREEDASWNLTGANPWILASSTDRKWHVALRDSDDRPFLMVDATADEFQAERWAQTQIADAVTELAKVARLRDAQQRLQREGLVIADPKGNPVPHPAIAIERAAQAEIRSWGAQFKPRRRR